MEAGATVFEIVIVVGDEVGVHAIAPQDVGHRVVEGLHRTPSPVHEVQTTGLDVAPRRHAG